MSIETLNSAARAAGFAMAMSDEPADDGKDQEHPAAWQPGDPVVLKAVEDSLGDVGEPAKSTLTDWVKGVFTSIGRRAPA
jgi:hypothetical protein